MRAGRSEAEPLLFDGRIIAVAAKIYSGEQTEDTEFRRAAQEFLTSLDYDDIRDGTNEHTRSNRQTNRSRLLTFASTHLELFQMYSRFAPEMVFIGALQSENSTIGKGSAIPGASFSGAGESFQSSFERTVGESIEYLSQFQEDQSQTLIGNLSDCFDGFSLKQRNQMIEWFNSADGAHPHGLKLTYLTELTTQHEILAPAALVFRGVGQSQTQLDNYALSTGCAAGETLPQAIATGLFEVIERDAAALWWQGGRASRRIEFEYLKDLGVIQRLEKMRAGEIHRTTQFIDISTEFEIPVVAAISYDRNGFGFAAGISCNSNLTTACISALNELFQMELGLIWLESKCNELGAAALDPKEQSKMQRSRQLNCLKEPLFSNTIQNQPNQIKEPSKGISLPFLLERLGKFGHQIIARDLTRAVVGIPATRVIVTGLQPYPSKYVSPRLSDSRQFGMRDIPATRGLELY